MQHAQPFTKVEEQLLWEREVLGTSTPKSLLNAVFYLNGKNFCLRGGEEHCHLAISQIVRQQLPINMFTQKQDQKTGKAHLPVSIFQPKSFQFMDPRKQEKDAM